MKKKKLNDELINHNIKKSYLVSLKDKLTDEQQEVVKAVNSNNNIFFTGKYYIFRILYTIPCLKREYTRFT